MPDRAKRLELRALVRDARSPSAWRVRAVRLLAPVVEEEDLAVLRASFPVEDDLELNIELALALLQQRDAAALEVLRTAVWEPSWNRSILAAGVLIRVAGEYVVIDELDSPPPAATEADVRRLGFALGQWGGLPTVEALARRRNEGDPALQGALLGALTTRSF